MTALGSYLEHRGAQCSEPSMGWSGLGLTSSMMAIYADSASAEVGPTAVKSFFDELFRRNESHPDSLLSQWNQTDGDIAVYTDVESVLQCDLTLHGWRYHLTIITDSPGGRPDLSMMTIKLLDRHSQRPRLASPPRTHPWQTSMRTLKQ